MKRTALMMSLFLFFFVFIGCDKTTEATTTALLLEPPIVTLEERLLSWDEVSSATSYLVYSDGDLLVETSSLGTIIPDTITDKQLSVVAKNGDVLSASSNKIQYNLMTLATNTYNTIDENDLEALGNYFLFNLSLTDTFVVFDFSGATEDLTFDTIVIVPSNVKKVQFIGNVDITVKGFNIAIKARDSDITLVFENFKMEGIDSNVNAITLEAPEIGNSGKLFIESIGNYNYIKAGSVSEDPASADAITHFFSGPASSGLDGYDGGHGIDAEQVILYGEANMYVIGGIGGDGANGGNSTGIDGSGGDGGDGGNGGDGIHCVGLKVYIQSGVSLNLSGGGGGNPGLGGTGIWGDGTDGDDGVAGEGLNGTLNRLNGVVSK